MKKQGKSKQMPLTKAAIRFHPLRMRPLAFLMTHFAPVRHLLVVTSFHDIRDVTLRIYLKQYVHTYTKTYMHLCAGITTAPLALCGCETSCLSRGWKTTEETLQNKEPERILILYLKEITKHQNEECTM